MTAAAGTAPVHLEVSEPVPVEAAAGSEIVLRVRASCRAGCDRSGMAIRAVAPDGSETAHPFAMHDGAASETADIVLRAPLRVGEHVWRFVLPAHEIDGVRYEETAISVPVRVRPQSTSLAVWAVPSPVVAGERFTVNVGAKSAAGCELKDRGVEIRSADGLVVARGQLGDAPWPGTAALYWTAIELPAPAEAGLCSWSVAFDAADLEISHDGAASTFGVAIVRPPQHKLTVKVIEKDTAAPIEDVLIRLGAYRATTGQSGLAEIRMPKGQYELQIWKVGYEAPSTTLQLDDDVSVQVEALVVPEEDPDAIWKM